MRLKQHALSANISLALGAFAGLSLPSAAWAQAEKTASASVISASFSGKTVAPTDTILVFFPSDSNVADGQFAVMVGNEDLSAQFRWLSPTQLEGVFAAMPLPVGKNELKIFLISEGNQWKEAGQLEITVASENAQASTKTATFKPTLILGSKSQVAQSHSPAATPPTRPTYLDSTTQASLQTEHGEDGWKLKSQFNLVGSSYQPEAVDYGNQQSNAPKLDLANYLVESSLSHKYGLTSFGLGQVQAGQHPLLASGIGHRGILLSHKFGERVDIAAAFQNGNAIVGGLNPLGLNDAEHRLHTFSVGVEALQRPGALRIEATSFSGIIKPKLTTGIATLQDAEESKGYGLRLKSQNTEGSLRADLAYAQSTYTPKGDSTLNILPGPATRGNSWYLDLGYDVLKNVAVSADFPLSLSLQAKHEYSSFGFKSLGVGAAADFEADTLGLHASLGVITSQLQLMRRADNVGNSPAFLKNRSAGYNLSLGLPMAQLIDKAQPSVWLPTLSLAQGRNHSYADTAFIPIGQTLANLSNVIATTQSLDANWVINKLNFGYQLSRSFQDNQQLGSETLDNKDLGHQIKIAYAASDRLNFTGGLGKRNSTALATGIKRLSNTAEGGINWLFGDRYTLSSTLSNARDHDSLLTTNSKVTQANLQLLKQFDIAAFGIKLPGQWMLGYTHSYTNSLGTIVRYNNLNAALSLAIF